MADRDINIPMGPDRTGRVSIPEVVPGAGSPADQTIAQPPISTADLRGLDVEGRPADPSSVDAWLNTPMDAAPAAGQPAASGGQTAAFSPVSATEPAAASGASAGAGSADPVTGYADTPQNGTSQSEIATPDSSSHGAVAATDANAANWTANADDAPEDDMGPDDAASQKPVNDVAASLGALRDSIGQGRELKAREKDREELAEKIDADREELADRDDILANYQSLVAEQDAVIAQSTQQRDARKAELSQVMAQTEETAEALNRMRDYNDVQLQPLETALGRAQATADQAKNDERSRKSELNAAESEARRAENGDDSTTAKARLEVVRAAHDEAAARSNAAKEALEEAQRAYDSLKEQVEQAEAPLERSLADLDRKTEELKETIARLGDTISAASKRRQYCDSVYQYPAETEKLRQAVLADEAALARMDEENDDLRDRLAQSKAKSTKAKVLIAGVVVFVILLILLFWYLSSR